MTTKNPIQKTLNYVEKHDLRAKVTMGDNGVIKIDDDLFEATAAMDAGVTLDQVKKLQKAEGELLTAVTYVSGELAAEAFKQDPNLVETGFDYRVGQTVKVAGMFNRDAKDSTVVIVETTHKSAEFGRVASALNGMFSDINS